MDTQDDGYQKFRLDIQNDALSKGISFQMWAFFFGGIEINVEYGQAPSIWHFLFFFWRFCFFWGGG